MNLECKLDLKNIALHARNAEYNPKRFAAVIMRIREPKSTALIFHSGKMVCTGTKSEAEARIASRKYAKILQKLSYAVAFKASAQRLVHGQLLGVVFVRCGISWKASLMAVSRELRSCRHRQFLCCRGTAVSL